MEVGGNKIALAIGTYLEKVAKGFIARGRTLTISNPTCKLINPFTLIINFTIDGNEKCQVITQGDYKVKYKEFNTEDNPISDDEMFIIIKEHKKNWFYKR